MTDTCPTFLSLPEPSAAVQHMYDDDTTARGFVMNLSTVWGHRPQLRQNLFDLFAEAADAAGLSVRQRAVLITAAASTRGDSYCSLAWGDKLAKEAGAGAAAGVLRGVDDDLSPADRQLARWARTVARDPNGASAGDVQALRDAGFDDGQIVALTVFVALRLAFSTVNDALGAQPDSAFRTAVAPEVVAAVDFGRPIAAVTA